MVDAASLETAIRSAAEAQKRALSIWYPQTGNNAPAERNYTVHLALALASRLPELVLYAEPNIGHKTSERIDLVGFDQVSRTLVVAEAKRFLETESAYGVLADVDRIRSFGMSNSNSHVDDVRAKWGIVLVSTIVPAHADWWCSAPEAAPVGIRSADSWLALSAHLRVCRATGGVGATQIEAYPRHLLWAYWKLSVS